MTLSMPDSIDVAALPSGYGQYLGYVDGRWPTAYELRKRFPAARIIGLTVTGGTLGAQGCDIEAEDLTPVTGASWAALKLGRSPRSRPVLYASVAAMGEVLSELEGRSIWRDQVRLLSAHYGFGEHICGPRTCGEINITMDGTQWTDQFRTLAGTVDMSVLQDGFFGSWTEEIVQQLPVVQQGDSGEAVRTVQGCVNARGNTGPVAVPTLVIDGAFGPKTRYAVEACQHNAGIPVDGIAGPQTWPVLLGIA